MAKKLAVVKVGKVGITKKASVKKPAKKYVAKYAAKPKTKAAKLDPLRRLSAKNKSATIPDGLIVRTRDEFFEGKKDYRKPGYENKGHYRRAVVIDSNRLDELILVKGLSNGISTKVLYFSHYKPFVETKDDDYNPIKLGYKFQETKDILPEEVVEKIKNDCYTTMWVKKRNIKKFKRLKARK